MVCRTEKFKRLLLLLFVDESEEWGVEDGVWWIRFGVGARWWSVANRDHRLVRAEKGSPLRSFARLDPAH